MQKELELRGDFKDHFSTQSDGYAKHRPTYPPALFQFLASLVTHRKTAWDCATGNGQAAIALTEYFPRVIATDASEAQISAATHKPGVEYRLATAERSGLADGSVDLITVAQALHWFDEKAFMEEVQRVIRANGVLAVWCYELCTVNAECDAIVDRLYTDIVGDYWLPERVTIEDGYSDVAMPGVELPVPDFSMQSQWQAADMLGYFRTWSATQRYVSDRGTDPVAEIEAELVAAWGEEKRVVSWPLVIRASRPNTLLE